MELSEKESSLKTSKSRTNLLFCLIPTEMKEKRRVSPKTDTPLTEEESGKKITESRRFSRVWKAVLSEPSTGKMIKKRKSDKKSPKSLTIESARYDYNKAKRTKDDFDLEHRLVERSASALSATAAFANIICPACSSPLTTARPARTTVEPNSVGSNKASHAVNAESQGARICRSSDCGLLLMLMILLILVFWGKLCAVFWTATWLFLAPHLTADACHVNGSPPLGMVKEKVVMDGFLARDRRRSIPCQ